MSKNQPQVKSEPAQPLLPAMNLAQLLSEPDECHCVCDMCPPWYHTHGECKWFCVQMWASQNPE
jgi:hypothetical protein